MKPIEFPQMNRTWAKNQPPYLPLPAYSNEEKTISCWQLTLWERIKLLFQGHIWLWEMNQGQPLQPQSLTIKNPFNEIQRDVDKRDIDNTVRRGDAYKNI